MSEVVVSIAVTSRRIGNLMPVLESLVHNQSLPPDRVVVWISPEPFLLDEGCEYSDLPEQARLWHRQGLIEVRTTANTGPHRKMIPLLTQHRQDPDPPILITADDDTLYPSKWLEALVTAYQATGAAVCFRGRAIARNGQGLKPYRNWPLIARYEEARSSYILATGREGLLIRADMFDPRTFTGDYLRFARSRCDVWMTAGLIAAGTEMYKLSLARIFPDPLGLEPREDFSLPKAAVVCGSPTRAATPRQADELWHYNQTKNDAIINATFKYFGIIEGRTEQPTDPASR